MSSRHPHPSGYPVAHDSPAHVAPPLELRRAVEATKEGSVEDAVAFTLAFPIVERTRVNAVIIEEEPEENTSPEFAIPEASGAAPSTADDTAVDLPVVDLGQLTMPASSTYPSYPAYVESEHTLERDPYRDEGETTLNLTERQSLDTNLQSIGPFQEGPDLSLDRTPAERVLLGRARAIRFRLALLDVWPEDHSSAAPIEEDLDLLAHPCIVVALADGFPADPRTGRGPEDVAIVRTLAEEVRMRLPHTTRATLREAGAAAFARVTLLGTLRAIDYVRERFAEWPSHARRAALAVATRIALGRPEGDPRSDALRMLREAVG